MLSDGTGASRRPGPRRDGPSPVPTTGRPPPRPPSRPCWSAWARMIKSGEPPGKAGSTGGPSSAATGVGSVFSRPRTT